MESADKKKFHIKHLVFAAAAAAVLLFAAVLQLHIPKDKNTVPGHYIANMFVVLDILCNETFKGTPEAYECMQSAFAQSKFHTQIFMWQSWYDNRRRER